MTTTKLTINNNCKTMRGGDIDIGQVFIADIREEPNLFVKVRGNNNETLIVLLSQPSKTDVPMKFGMVGGWSDLTHYKNYKPVKVLEFNVLE